MLAGVAVGYTDLFGVLLSFVIVATVQMKRGGIEVNALFVGTPKRSAALVAIPTKTSVRSASKSLSRTLPSRSSFRCSGLMPSPRRCSVAFPQKNSPNR